MVRMGASQGAQTARIAARGGASPMALLIGLGAIVPASHWQKPHTVAEGAREIDDMLCEELHRKGSLAWNGAAGAALLERLSKATDRGETGWAAIAEMRHLLDQLRNPEPELD